MRAFHRQQHWFVVIVHHFPRLLNLCLFSCESHFIKDCTEVVWIEQIKFYTHLQTYRLSALTS